MTDNDLAVISAFYDHEPVNIESLATALESSEARALLGLSALGVAAR